MDKIDGLRELKKLLDENVITEDEFGIQKSKLLGLDSEIKGTQIEESNINSEDNRSVEQILMDYEESLIGETNSKEQPDNSLDEEDVDIEPDLNNEYIANNSNSAFEVEVNVPSNCVEEIVNTNPTSKDGIDNTLESDREFFEKERLKHLAKLKAEEEIKNERKANNLETINKGMGKVQWVFKWTLAILLWFFGILSFFSQSLVAYKFASLIIIIEGCFACPKITEFMNKKEPVFAKYKTIFVILGIVLFFAILAFVGKNL